eukprot:gene19306-13959_t
MACCNYGSCSAVVDDYISRGWAYDSCNDFAQCAD